jgi:hypothetical protein
VWGGGPYAPPAWDMSKDQNPRRCSSDVAVIDFDERVLLGAGALVCGAIVGEQVNPSPFLAIPLLHQM